MIFFFGDYSEASGSSELRMLSDLSPGSRKRTGRAYVALARAQSEKYVFGLSLLPPLPPPSLEADTELNFIVSF